MRYARECARGVTAAILCALAPACLPSESLDGYSSGTRAGAGGNGGSDLPSSGAGGSGGSASPADDGETAGAGGSGGVAPDPADSGSSGAVSDAATEGGPPPPPLCSGGSLGPDGESCYFLETTIASWSVARQACEDAGRLLVQIESEQEDTFIAGLSASSLWIGASDTVVDGSFVWSDGSAIVFTNWGPAQPDAYPGPDCVEKRQEANEPWYDQPCGDAKRFVCESPAP